MIREIARYGDARRGLLDEINRCWNVISVSQNLLGYTWRCTRDDVALWHQARRRQLVRQAVAVVHADRAEDRLAALPKPYSVEWMEAFS